ncbi:MAG: hypothetical protein P0120_24840 [Nitrospira sp.]|nr:hypothetical protein [Nitrospira sp.]
MKQVMAVITIWSLVVPALVLVDSNAWSGCTIEQRIDLGKQGYDKGEVEKACSDSGDDFWNTMGKALGNTLSDAMTRGVDKAFGGSGKNPYTDASAMNGASRCETNVGTCPLSGGPAGYPCYCRGWNGSTLTGVSR